MRIGKKKKKNIKTFYELNYDIVLSFGLTELKAQIAWQENVSLDFLRSFVNNSQHHDSTRDAKLGVSLFVRFKRFVIDSLR